MRKINDIVLISPLCLNTGVFAQGSYDWHEHKNAMDNMNWSESIQGWFYLFVIIGIFYLLLSIFKRIKDKNSSYTRLSDPEINKDDKYSKFDSDYLLKNARHNQDDIPYLDLDELIKEGRVETLKDLLRQFKQGKKRFPFAASYYDKDIKKLEKFLKDINHNANT